MLAEIDAEIANAEALRKKTLLRLAQTEQSVLQTSRYSWIAAGFLGFSAGFHWMIGHHYGQPDVWFGSTFLLLLALVLFVSMQLVARASLRAVRDERAGLVAQFDRAFADLQQIRKREEEFARKYKQN